MDQKESDQPYRRIAVAELRLDPGNPRLPPDSESWDQEKIFDYIRSDYGIDDLVSSMIDNGYFEQEPLIGVSEDDRIIIVEGNRRLCALKSIHRELGEDDYDLDLFTSEAQKRLETVPVLLIPDRDSIQLYLGYRHISGLKTWRPEAKARFVAQQVQNNTNEEDPFKAVGRMIGSNAAGVRSFYRAYKLLDHARNETSSDDVSYIFRNKFGVWTRLLNSTGYRKYIGLADATTKPEVDHAIENVNNASLVETLGDLIPPDDRTRALLHDSREASDYGNVLSVPHARSVLRSTRNISLAASVVDVTRIDIHLEEVADRIEQLRRLIEKTDLDIVGDAEKIHHATSRIESEVAYLRIQTNRLKKQGNEST